MTALYFETEDEQQLDTAIFDGYPVGDRILEGVRFITKIVNGKLEAIIHPEDEIVQLKEFMVKDSETITSYYKNTVVGELWEILNK